MISSIQVNSLSLCREWRKVKNSSVNGGFIVRSIKSKVEEVLLTTVWHCCWELTLWCWFQETKFVYIYTFDVVRSVVALEWAVNSNTRYAGSIHGVLKLYFHTRSALMVVTLSNGGLLQQCDAETRMVVNLFG